jgi:hypothetical protein
MHQDQKKKKKKKAKSASASSSKGSEFEIHRDVVDDSENDTRDTRANNFVGVNTNRKQFSNPIPVTTKGQKRREMKCKHCST